MEEPCKVLIVDDEMLIRQGIINYIDWESEGFHIVGEASNGKEAMDKIEQFHPHIVITDIVMPVMDGIDLVKQVKKAYPAIEIIVLSSFENYDYVRSTFQNGVADYILKPKLNGEELRKTLNQVVDKIPKVKGVSKVEPKWSVEEKLEKMIVGYDFALGESSLHCTFNNSHFVLVSAVGKDLNPSELKKVIKNSCDDLPVLSLFLEENTRTFLINLELNQLESIKQTIEKLSTEDPKVTWLVARPFDSINEIKNVYDDSLMKMKQYLFYLPEQSLFRYDDLPVESKKQIHFDLNHFIEMFKNKQFNDALAYLTDYVDYLATQYSRDSFEFKSFLGNIIFNMIVLLDNLNYDIKDLERKKYSYFSTINEANDINQTFDQFNEFLEKVKTIIFSNETSNDHNQLDEMLHYIEQHYTEPLRLSEIADHFHFNPSYLSSYFSSHHKEGFSEYLNRVRIKKSMELLENSTVSISNISGMVGYSEHSYFCKVFKRITGMSPSSYRKEYRN